MVHACCPRPWEAEAKEIRVVFFLRLTIANSRLIGAMVRSYLKNTQGWGFLFCLRNKEESPKWVIKYLSRTERTFLKFEQKGKQPKIPHAIPGACGL